MRIQCSYLPYTTALLLAATMHLSFVISASQGYFDWCVPYWADCVSISRSGRYGLAYFVFKGGMMPAIVLIALFWYLTERWLRTLGHTRRWLLPVGILACLALMTYTLSLGHSGDGFRTLRRFGVVLFLGLSFVNFAGLAGALADTRFKLAGQHIRLACAAILGIALFSLVLDAWMGEDYDRLENAFEWWLIMMLVILLAGIGRLWKTSGFYLHLKLEN